MKKTTQRLKGNQFIILGLPATGIALCLLLIISASAPHDAELRFTEFSDRQEVLGGMLPASCESGGNDLVGPDHVTACSWTTYCTGQNDPNQFQWWQYSNEDDWRPSGAGSCAPSWETYCTGPYASPAWEWWQRGYDQGGGGMWYLSSPGTSCSPTVNVWP